MAKSRIVIGLQRSGTHLALKLLNTLFGIEFINCYNGSYHDFNAS